MLAIGVLMHNYPNINIIDYWLVGGIFSTVLLKPVLSVYKIQKDFKTFKNAYNTYKEDLDNNFTVENIKDLQYMLEDEKLNNTEINQLMTLVDKENILNFVKEKGYLNIIDLLKIKENIDKLEKEKENINLFLTENKLEELTTPKSMFQYMI